MKSMYALSENQQRRILEVEAKGPAMRSLAARLRSLRSSPPGDRFSFDSALQALDKGDAFRARLALNAWVDTVGGAVGWEDDMNERQKLRDLFASVVAIKEDFARLQEE